MPDALPTDKQQRRRGTEGLRRVMCFKINWQSKLFQSSINISSTSQFGMSKPQNGECTVCNIFN